MLLIQTLRPDRLLAATQQFVAAVMGMNFLAEAEQELKLSAIVENEVSDGFRYFQQINMFSTLENMCTGQYEMFFQSSGFE